MSFLRTAAPILALLLITRIAPAESRLDLINTLQGTDSTTSLSRGFCLPLVGTPWGMTNFSPQTVGGSFFQYGRPLISGIRATHQPSPWMGDYGYFNLMPQTGDLATGTNQRASEYEPLTFHPDYLKLTFKKYNITTELTASERCAILRFTFAQPGTGRLIIDPPGESHTEINGRTITGFTKASSGGTPPNFACYFDIELDRDITATGAFSANTPRPGEKSATGRNAGAYVEFSTANQHPVEVKVATSFISLDQARQNLAAETAGGFDALRQRTAATWEKQLAIIDLEGATDEQQRTFYTCLYRAQMSPHRFHEITAAGDTVHYSAYDGQVHPGVAYTDNGFWDTHRTVYPLYSILFPKQEAEIIQGYLAAYREGGWLPQWPSPGYRLIMIGSHIDAVIADAVAKNITGFDLDTAYEAMRKDAFTPDRHGREGLADYLRLGYIPTGHARYEMSTSLDYAYDDWCLAQVARKLGKTADYQTLMARADNYKKSWDPAVGFMREHGLDGHWSTPTFDEFAWGGPYVEGGPWQCSWAVPHDVAGLIQLVGGPDAMVAKLDKLLATDPIFHTGGWNGRGYKGTIHEMTEMAIQKFGQYDHGNQPGHHILYLFTAAGKPSRTEYWTRRVCDELYNSGPKGFPGDEDNGEMASWYILSSLGFYPLCPGRPEYVLTSPLFPKATIHLPSGKDFTISAPNNSPQNVYIQSRQLNGQDYSNTWLAQDSITAGGTMTTTQSPTPTDRPLKPEELPHSMSTEK